MAKQDVDRLVQKLGVPRAAAECRVAGILFTYRCSISCRHCLFGCSSERPDIVMTPRQCADNLALLHETGRVVHIAGGEPMLYWDALCEAIRLAYQEDNAPHFIETNCSFAVNDEVARQRLTFLATHGVKGLLASADPFHQEFVPPDRFLRVRRLAAEIFSSENFYGSDAGESLVREYRDIARDKARLRSYVRKHPPCMVGSAHAQLAHHLDACAPDDSGLPPWRWRAATPETGCLSQFQAETMWELHIDPYGNILTNCGLILGTIGEVSPARLLARGPETANGFVRTVCEHGALGLAERARREHGFAFPEQVTQTCELCYLARRFLHKFHPQVFGPAEIYS